MQERINLRMKALGLKSVDLVRATKANKGTVSTWVNGLNEPKGEYLFSLAHALGTTPEWLVTGRGGVDALEQDIDGAMRLKNMIPVISEVQAGVWSDIKDLFADSDAIEWISSTRKFSKHAFGLRVVGDSMYCPGNPKSLSEDEIVVVDPEVAALHRDVIVARMETTDKATVKQLVIDGDEKFLNPLNDRYKPIPIDGNVILVGVVMDVVRRFK